MIKSINVESSSEFAPIYEIVCNKSTLVTSLASCHIKLDGSFSWTTINKDERFAPVVPYGKEDIYGSFSNFLMPDNTDVIFSSEDGALNISVEKNDVGSVF